MSISDRIKTAEPEEMSDILTAAQNRYNELFPDWEIILLTLEKAVDKNEQIDAAITLLTRMKEL